MTVRVPMSVIGGFLGAGKTTLLNRVLAGRHGVRYAVLVNDFGELNIDGDLVAAHGGDTVTFANGCVCCTIGDDLVGAIERLLDGDRRPEQILVEASGVADPAAIADVATLHPGLARDLVVVLADAETVRTRHGDERLRDTVDRQLAAADLIVLNKCDRVTEAATEAAESWLRGQGRAPVIRTVAADIPMELLAAARVDPPASAKAGGAPDHYHQFRSRVVPCPDPIDPGRLRASRRVHALGPFRAHRQRVVLVAPVVEVVGEEVGADSEAGHAAEVGVVGHLAVLQGEAGVRGRGRRARAPPP